MPLDLSLDYLPRLPREKSAPIGCIGSGFIMADCHLVAYRETGEVVEGEVEGHGRFQRDAEKVARNGLAY